MMKDKLNHFAGNFESFVMAMINAYGVLHGAETAVTADQYDWGKMGVSSQTRGPACSSRVRLARTRLLISSVMTYTVTVMSSKFIASSALESRVSQRTANNMVLQALFSPRDTRHGGGRPTKLQGQGRSERLFSPERLPTRCS